MADSTRKNRSGVMATRTILQVENVLFLLKFEKHLRKYHPVAEQNERTATGGTDGKGF